MLEDRNIKYPSYVLALLLAYIAFIDAGHGLGMQTGSDSGAWFLELASSAICTVIATLLLTRPHLWFFCAAAIWSLLAFLGNFIMKLKDTTPIQRETIYWIVLVGACVLIVIEGFKWYQVWSKRPRPMYQYPPGYPPQVPQYAPPPPPPAPPAAPPAPPAARAPRK
jgi:hypothetical protein